MSYFRASDGCRFFFDYQHTASQKPAIVFLNGTIQTAVNWKTVSNLLKDGFQVLTFDARGQGKSDLGDKPLSLSLHAEDLRDLLNHLEIMKVQLVGLSHGASVALQFASRLPERVDRLILCSASARPSRRAMLAVRSWLELLKNQGMEAMTWSALPVMFGEDFLQRNETMLSKMVQAIVRRNKKEALLAHLRAVMDYPPLSAIAPDVHRPALVLSASDDPLVSEAGARELADLCHASYQYVRGTGHSIPAEAPELFTGILRGYLTQ